MKIIARYRWIDIEGHECWHLRLNGEPKFIWAQDCDGYSTGRGQCHPTLYHLHHLQETTEAIVVEGEHDVETVQRLLIDGVKGNSLRVTCTPNGADDVKPEYLIGLHGKARVWICGDNDSAGVRYRDAIAMHLRTHVMELRDLRVPKEFKDWAEWEEKGGTSEGFCDLLMDAPPLTAPLPPWKSSLSLIEEAIPETQWIIEGLIPAGAVVLLSGREGSMKSWLALHWASAVAQRGSWLGHPCEQGGVLYLDGEMPADLFKARLKSVGPSSGLNTWQWCAPNFPTRLDDPNLLWASQCHRLIIIDTLRRFMGDFQENSSDDMAKITGMMRELTRHGSAVLALHHSLKDEEKRGYRGSTELGAGVDITMSLVKKGTQDPHLSLSTQKTRYWGVSTLELGVESHFDAPFFLERESNGRPKTSAGQLAQLRTVIASLEREHQREPNQSQIVIAAKDLAGRLTIRDWLKEGDGRYWQSSSNGHICTYKTLSSCLSVYPLKGDAIQTDSPTLSVFTGGIDNGQTDSE